MIINNEEELQKYFEHLTKYYDHELINKVKKTWTELKTLLGSKLSLPVVMPLNDDTITLVWENGIEYIDLDIYKNGNIHWFYRHLKNDTVCGSEEEVINELTVDILKHLEGFIFND